MLARNVTTLIKDLNPRVENYLRKLIENNPMQIKQVHESSAYEPLVHQMKAWACMGVFYDYLIRKEIYNLLEKEAIDHRASTFEEQLADYNEILNVIKSSRVPADAGEPEIDDEGKELADSIFPIDVEKLRKPLASYQKYKDPKNATLDIIEDIFNTSMLHRLFFGDSMLAFDPKLLNMDNLKTVLKHVGTFNRNNISLNPVVGCEYFRGDADLILDDVLLDIKLSMYALKLTQVQSRRQLYQLIFYALGVFVNEGKEIRKFKIYNPLLGIEYFLEIPELNFPEFLKLVEEVKHL